MSDTPFRTSKTKPIDHRATSIFSDIEITTNKKVIVKKFDKKNYMKDLCCQGSEIERLEQVLPPKMCSQFSVTSLKNSCKVCYQKKSVYTQ